MSARRTISQSLYHTCRCSSVQPQAYSPTQFPFDIAIKPALQIRCASNKRSGPPEPSGDYETRWQRPRRRDQIRMQAKIQLLRPKLNIDSVLGDPSWSIHSLLPSSPEEEAKGEISVQQLHHLLRLSALPLPKDQQEEEEMLRVLQRQLHFVRQIQAVDTEGVEPLCSLRDETTEGIEEATIGLQTHEIEEVLSREDVVGRMRRPRRRRSTMDDQEAIGEKQARWDVFETAGETIEHAGGRYFVVRSGKGDA